jgi:2,4-dienoyl-CoA reductase-like NADH-dependent reductase (Old Yellow Enzyme family)
MNKLFESSSINGMLLKNRFVRSATWTAMATEDGFMTDKLRDLIVNVAKGGVALVVPDFAPVLKSGQTSIRQLGLYKDELIPGLSSLVDAVHAAGSKIVIQLVHGGAHSRPDLTGT